MTCLSLSVMLAFVAIFLAGCANESLGTSDVMLEAERAEIPGEALGALPPQAGAVDHIAEQHYENGLRQAIVLTGGTVASDEDATNGGENALYVATQKRRLENFGPDRMLRMHKPDRETIDAEMRARLPGVTMTHASRHASNAYGVVGFARGRTEDGGRCFYAWQWIDGKTGEGSLFGFDRLRKTNDISVRVRLCGQSLTEKAFLAIVERLRLRGDLAAASS